MEEEIPHAVLMDIRVHGVLGGVETAGQIRSRFDVPVVYLTGFAGQQPLDRVMETEPYGCLVKPVEIRARSGKRVAPNFKFVDTDIMVEKALFPEPTRRSCSTLKK